MRITLKNISRIDSSRREFYWKLALLILPMLIVLIVFQMLPEKRIPDLSNGLFPETFRTRSIVLQKELVFLDRVMRINPPLRETPNARSLLMLYWKKNDFSPERFSSSFAELVVPAGEKFSSFRNLTENPETTPVLPALFAVQRENVILFSKRGNSASALRSLESLFDFGWMMLNSDAPDLYYLESAVETAEKLKRRFSGNSVFERRYRRDMLRQSGRKLPWKNLFRSHCLESMRDYEKLRLNGLRLFTGEPEPFSAMKEAFRTFSVSKFFDALRVAVRDHFYNVDRDEIQMVRITRKILLDGPENQVCLESGIPFEKFSLTDHRLSSGYYRKIMRSIQRQADLIRRIKLLTIQ